MYKAKDTPMNKTHNRQVITINMIVPFAKNISYNTMIANIIDIAIEAVPALFNLLTVLSQKGLFSFSESNKLINCFTITRKHIPFG